MRLHKWPLYRYKCSFLCHKRSPMTVLCNQDVAHCHVPRGRFMGIALDAVEFLLDFRVTLKASVFLYVYWMHVPLAVVNLGGVEGGFHRTCVFNHIMYINMISAIFLKGFYDCIQLLCPFFVNEDLELFCGCKTLQKNQYNDIPVHHKMHTHTLTSRCSLWLARST